jgi:hypothetical protein
VYDDQYEQEQDTVRKDKLLQSIKECKEHCMQLEMEWRNLDELAVKQQLEGVTLTTDKKLIDLLLERIVDPDPEWKTKLDTLIHIPHGIKGDILRGGDYFEALFQLAIAIGILPEWKGKYIRFYDIHDYREMKPFPNYLYEKPIKNSGGAEQGISDITFEVSSNPEFETRLQTKYDCGCVPPVSIQSSNPFYFISVKGYKKEKSIKDEYDIPLLDWQIRMLPELTKHIIVCVKDEQAFKQRLSRTKMDFLKNRLHGNKIMGYDTLIDAFTTFRIAFFNRFQAPPSQDQIRAEIQLMYPPDQVHKPCLNLYFHQELIVQSVIKRIQEVEAVKPHFLCIGVLPRGGKSFIAGGIISAHKKIKNSDQYNVLFMTSAVNETRDQFKTDLIDQFSEFSDFDFIDVVQRSPITKPNHFYFISRQLSSMTHDDEIERVAVDLLEKVGSFVGQHPEIDIIFFDEAHIGITSKTIRSHFQKIFETFPIPIILMTATYKKPSRLLDEKEDLFVWDLQDIKDMKSLPVLGMDGFIAQKPDVLERYQEIAAQILQRRISYGESLESISKPYIQFPNPNFISLTFAPDAVRRLLSSHNGYQFDKAFEMNVDDDTLCDPDRFREWGSMIRHREDAIQLRQFMTPEDEDPTQDRKYRALNQIFRIAQRNQSRPIQGKPFSILMFLPFGGKEHTKIGELCRVWASFMMELQYWRDHFVFLTLSTYNNKKYVKKGRTTIENAVEKGICHRDDFDMDLKKLIIDVEKEALRREKGLVILSGDVAKMGISLKCVDVVFLMSHNTDADDIIQKMYRALTDDPPMKKDGFIVDLNMTRTIRAMFDYDMEKDKLRAHKMVNPSVKQRIHKLFDLCNWGVDQFIEDHPEMSFDDIMNEIKERVVDQLEKNIINEFDSKFNNMQEEQFKMIYNNPTLYQKIQEALQSSRAKKPKRPKSVTLSTRNPGLVSAQAAQSAQENDEKTDTTEQTMENEQDMQEVVSEPVVHMLSPLQIKHKLKAILITFVNALVIKSAEPWSDALNLTNLLQQYHKDKPNAGDPPECDCTANNNCKKDHVNIYESVFCELKSYAMILISPSSTKYKYSPETHMMIMEIVEEIFQSPYFIAEWNLYIETLLRDIKTPKRGGFQTTRKKLPALNRDNGRKV